MLNRCSPQTSPSPLQKPLRPGPPSPQASRSRRLQRQQPQQSLCRQTHWIRHLSMDFQRRLCPPSPEKGGLFGKHQGVRLPPGPGLMSVPAPHPGMPVPRWGSRCRTRPVAPRVRLEMMGPGRHSGPEGQRISIPSLTKAPSSFTPAGGGILKFIICWTPGPFFVFVFPERTAIHPAPRLQPKTLVWIYRRAKDGPENARKLT